MFAKPEDHIRRLRLREGMSVADIGCGTGAYALLASRIVGQSGKVYAIDVQEPLLKSLASRAREMGISNIRIIRADAEQFGGTGIADVSVGAVIVANMLFQAEERKHIVAELRRTLVSGGRVMVVDWRESYGGLGPASDAVITEKDAIRLFVDAGFVFEESFDAGDHHYGILFIKP